jgi:hypothetical protein
MKKTLFVLCICIAAASIPLFAFSSKMKITGLVHMYGSAPHVYPGFVADDGKMYSLEVDDKSEVTLEGLQSMQGMHVELTGRLRQGKNGAVPSFNELKDGTFVVYSAAEKK